MSKRELPKKLIDASIHEDEPSAPSKRDQLKQMMGQAKLMEIIDQAYENADACENCKALSDWWEAYGASTAPPELVQRGMQRARR